MKLTTDSPSDRLSINRRKFLREVAEWVCWLGQRRCWQPVRPSPHHSRRRDAPARRCCQGDACGHTRSGPGTRCLCQDRRPRGWCAPGDRLVGSVGLAGKKILLKPNFNSADPAPGSTHLDVLRTLVKELRPNAGAITLADRSGMGDTRQVMEPLGVWSWPDVGSGDDRAR